MRLLTLFLIVFALNCEARMSPENERWADFEMIENNLKVRKKLSTSQIDEIKQLRNRSGTFYAVLKGRCMVLVEVGSKSSYPRVGRARRSIKDIKGPYCFRK
jgi:hypothetical protein